MPEQLVRHVAAEIAATDEERAVGGDQLGIGLGQKPGGGWSAAGDARAASMALHGAVSCQRRGRPAIRSPSAGTLVCLESPDRHTLSARRRADAEDPP
jgi:hypothetical protein